MSKRATIYLDPKIHHALKIKAAQTHSTLSDLVNDAVRFSLREDAVDLQAVWDRKREPIRSYECVIRDLKRDGLL